MLFATQLRTIMDERGLSQTAMSHLTGIGKSSICQYLSGANVPTDKRKAELAEKLGLAADYFKKSSVQTTIKHENNLPVRIAAQLMGKSKRFVYQGLQDGVFPWGYAVKIENEWSYYISPSMFTKYTGLEIEF